MPERQPDANPPRRPCRLDGSARRRRAGRLATVGAAAGSSRPVDIACGNRARDAGDVKELRLDVSPFVQAIDRRAKKNFRRTLTRSTHLTGVIVSRFHDRIRPAVEAELDVARRAEQRGDADEAFACLERAHVLGQPSTRLHTRVHWFMLRWAMRQRDGGEAVGQIFRIAAAAMKTAFGWLPHGNTGGTKVGAFRPMPVAPELQRLIDAARG